MEKEVQATILSLSFSTAKIITSRTCLDFQWSSSLLILAFSIFFWHPKWLYQWHGYSNARYLYDREQCHVLFSMGNAVHWRLWRLWVSTWFLLLRFGSYPVKSGVTIAKVHSETFLPEWMNSKTVYLLMAGNEQKLFGQFLKGSVMKRSSHVFVPECFQPVFFSLSAVTGRWLKPNLICEARLLTLIWNT